MTPRGAIDIGSNAVRLLVVAGDGTEQCRHARITRLGEGVDRTGVLGAAAMQRTLEVLGSYRQELEVRGVQRLRVAATSAARDAANREVFFAEVRALLGAAPEVLSGSEEAALAFRGATTGRDGSGAPFLTLDIGGGSTELAFGEARPEQSISLDIGSVRLTERCLASDPPTPAELDAAAQVIRGHLARADRAVPCRRARTWLGLAGTVTSIAALDARLERYDARVVDGYVLERPRVEAMHEELAALDTVARARLLLEPKRAPVIVGGTLILREVMRYFDVPALVVSEHDILDGLVASLAAPPVHNPRSDHAGAA